MPFFTQSEPLVESGSQHLGDNSDSGEDYDCGTSHGKDLLPSSSKNDILSNKLSNHCTHHDSKWSEMNKVDDNMDETVDAGAGVLLVGVMQMLLMSQFSYTIMKR